mgnify:CR=1 FL=1
MEAYYVMTYGAKSRSLPLLPPLFENNEAGGDFLAKEALDAVKDAEQKAAGILEDYNYSANHSPNYLSLIHISEPTRH